MPLHVHSAKPHTVQNANVVQAAERQDINSRVAVWLTSHVGTMLTAYVFMVLAFIGLFGVLNVLPPIAYVLIAWLSQTFIQLVLLPIIMVGQNVLNRKSEIQADEQFHIVQNTEHDEEQNIQHLGKQDHELLKQTRLLLIVVAALGALGLAQIGIAVRRWWSDTR